MPCGARLPANGGNVTHTTAIRPAVDPREFRQSLGCFPTGVAIVTTLDSKGKPVGVTISSFNSVSMTPPLILWSIALSAGSLPVFRANPGFVVNVLAAD